MMARKSVAQRLNQSMETITRQSDRLDEGSWLLGSASEPIARHSVRTQFILTVFILTANIIGVAMVGLLVTVAFPLPSVFSDAPWWMPFVVTPAYITGALVLGFVWATRRMARLVRWAIEDKTPTPTDQRNTFLAPWRLTVIHLILWGGGTVLAVTLYGLVNPEFIPKLLFSVSFSGIVVSTSCYLFTEFALRPIAALALAAGRPPRRVVAGFMSRLMSAWVLGSGIPVAGIIIAAVFSLVLDDMTRTQFAVAVLIMGSAAFVFGFMLMWIASWMSTTPVRVVLTALQRVEQGDLDTRLTVFDGTELGELQSGFNSMVSGLNEREHLRDLFGRHVGREVAAAAELHRPQLGGEEEHVAIVFVDMVGSTKLVASRPATEVVDLLNRFFGVIVDEVERHHGLVNKFVGDAVLAVFGAPVHLHNPEDEALAAARAIVAGLRSAVPECQAGIAVTGGQVVAGNVGAKERFEYTVIGETVNEAARLCELAKSTPGWLLASSCAVTGASENERAHWSLGDTVTLRGLDQATRLATPN